MLTHLYIHAYSPKISGAKPEKVRNKRGNAAYKSKPYYYFFINAAAAFHYADCAASAILSHSDNKWCNIHYTYELHNGQTRTQSLRPYQNYRNCYTVRCVPIYSQLGKWCSITCYADCSESFGDRLSTKLESAAINVRHSYWMSLYTDCN